MSTQKPEKKKTWPYYALEAEKELKTRRQNKTPVVFLDYDGTLTPIVKRPDQAVLSDSMREALRGLCARYSVAIISGRDREDVKSLVGVDGLFYAGSHGLDLETPEHHIVQKEEGRLARPALEEAAEQLRAHLGAIEGLIIEKKAFALAVHFRQVMDPRDVERIEHIVSEVAEAHTRLRKTGGKKIFELRPDVDWDKGKALKWILQQLHWDNLNLLAYYLGDDETDEDAFVALESGDIGILVDPEPSFTYAEYYLKDPREVETFLREL